MTTKTKDEGVKHRRESSLHSGYRPRGPGRYGASTMVLIGHVNHTYASTRLERKLALHTREKFRKNGGPMSPE